jgi:hypothetical protein
MPSLHDRELLAKGQVFESQIGAEPKGSKNQRKQVKNHQDHGREVTGQKPEKSIVSKRPEFWRTTALLVCPE